MEKKTNSIKKTTEELDQQFMAIQPEIEYVEKEFIAIEKTVYQTIPLFEKILERLEKVSNYAKENNLDMVRYKIKNLYHNILFFQKNNGYNVLMFHDLFEEIDSLKKKLPDDLLPEKYLYYLKERIKTETHNLIGGFYPNRKNLKRFYALINDNTHYLVEADRKLWEGPVPNKNKIKIQIKPLQDNKTHQFKQLPGYNPENKKEKKGVLFQLPDGSSQGYIADTILGSYIFSKKLLKKKIDYFPVGDSNFTPFITIKGERYFLR